MPEDDGAGEIDDLEQRVEPEDMPSDSRMVESEWRIKHGAGKHDGRRDERGELDDVTDEDAFAVVPEFNGKALSVGRKLPGAEQAFQSPSAVRSWLVDLCRVTAEAI